jgi:hypothetical protein
MPYDLSACGRITVSELLVQENNATDGKGVILRNGDMPLITRGWDCFTSGPKSGIGRWGLFMEAGETYLAAPGSDYGGARIGLGGFLADGTKQNVLTVMTCTRRVGIGTMCPSHPLHIYDGGNSVYARWERSTGDMYIGSDSIGGAIGVIGNIPLYFYTVDGTERMRLSQCGNLGIGTNDPITKLHVEQSTSGEVGRFRANVAGCADVVIVNNAQTWGFRVDNAASNALHIRNFQNSTNIMTLTTGGSVGVGTTSPRYSLDVAGGAISTFYMSCCAATVDGIGPYDYGIIGSGNGAGALLINDIVGARYSVAAGSYNLTFRKSVRNTTGACVYCSVMTFVGTTDTNCVPNVNIENSLGVGVASPSYRLHVNGTFYAAGSSQDYKEGICQYDTDSCLFMCLKPKTYQYKDEWKHLGKDLKSETQIGLIAEEVAESHPELAILVNEEDNKVVRNVDYEKLSIVLLAEVQKLRQEVDQLKQN